MQVWGPVSPFVCLSQIATARLHKNTSLLWPDREVTQRRVTRKTAERGDDAAACDREECGC